MLAPLLRRVHGCDVPCFEGMHANVVLAVTLSRARSQLYTCSLDGTLRLWRVQTGELRDTYRIGHPVVSLVRCCQRSSELLFCWTRRLVHACKCEPCHARDDAHHVPLCQHLTA